MAVSRAPEKSATTLHKGERVMSTKGGFKWTPTNPKHGRRSVKIKNDVAHLIPEDWEDFSNALVDLGKEFGIRFEITGGPKGGGASGPKKKAVKKNAIKKRASTKVGRKTKAAKK
jgi:hypothetical protein